MLHDISHPLYHRNHCCRLFMSFRLINTLNKYLLLSMCFLLTCQCHVQSACKLQCVWSVDLMHQLQRKHTPKISAICCWQPLIVSIQPCHLRQCWTHSIVLAFVLALVRTLIQLRFWNTAMSRRAWYNSQQVRHSWTMQRFTSNHLYWHSKQVECNA